MTIRETFDQMRTAMEAAGYPVVLKLGRGPQSEYWPRSIIAYYLYADRWNDRRIGELMRRDRATITCARQRVQAALDLPDMYDDVVEIIDNFKKKYYELFGQNL
jgi:hypothetical protein